MATKEKDNMKKSSSWLLCSMKCFSLSYSPKKSEELDDNSKTPQNKPGGWKSMPYVLGNETFERLATMGLLSNIMVYFLKEYHMDQVFATNVLNIWSGTTNFAPLIGAFISDAYLGRFRTLAISSMASLLGMITLTLTASLPNLLPPHCPKELKLHPDQCVGPTSSQLAVLFTSLAFLTVGAGGIRPCSVPFGVDQFDHTTEEGRKGIDSFFNWYYFTFTIVIMISLTVIVYIQNSVSWIIGLAIPTGLMFCSIVLFFIGTRIYVYVKPEGSIFSGIVQVFVAAYKKRHLKLDEIENCDQVLYDPPMVGTVVSKLPLTQQFRILNKAAVVLDGEVDSDGARLNKWSVCSIQQVEEVKCLIRIIPIWASGIVCFTAMAQQGTFTVNQALQMDRHLGPKFQIPAGSLAVISMLALGIWVPLYDRVLVPRLRKITKKEGGITLLQRMGIGMVFSVLSMVAAGIFETKRRNSAQGQPDGIASITVMWLSPQLVLMGLAEAFNIIAQIEFYYKQFPEHMRTIANSLLFCTMAGANYLSSMIVAIVHKTTAENGHPDWLTNDINAGRVDYFYYLLAGLGVLNFIYFIIVAKRYHYKGSVPIPDQDIELSKTKNLV